MYFWGSWAQHPLVHLELLPRTVCDTHCSLSVAPVTVQEELVPIYFLPFLDHGFLFLFFFLSPSFLLFFLLCVCAFLCVCMCSWVCMHSSLGTWNNRQLLTLGWFPPHHDWPSLVNLVCSLSWDQSKGKLRAAQFISESISCLTHGWLFYSHEYMSVFECPMSPKSTCQFYSGFYIV